MHSRLWEKTLQNIHYLDRAHSEAGFWPISLPRIIFIFIFTEIPSHTHELFLSLPEELRAGEGVDLYYTLHLHPKIYRIVCLVFVSALVELTKSLTLSLVAYRPEALDVSK